MRSTNPSEKSHRAWDAAAAAGIFLALAVICWPLRTAGFIWNDADYVTAPALRSLAGLRQIWFKLGATDRAPGCFQMAVRLAPRYADAHYNPGLAYVRKGMIHEAVVAFEAANQIDPTRPDVYRQLADILQRSGPAAQAAQLLQRARIEEAKRASPVHSP